jgi:hypothetical protein
MTYIIPHAFVAIMAKKSVHEAIHGFDETVVFYEDLCYAMAAAKVGTYGFINQKVFTSFRRFKKDGWFFNCIRSVLAEVYTIVIGPIRSNIFNYKFNHYKDDNRT